MIRVTLARQTRRPVARGALFLAIPLGAGAVLAQEVAPVAVPEAVAVEAPVAANPEAKLVQEYEAALVKYVEEPRIAAGESLTKGYVAALERVKGQAMAAGQLEAVLALRGEIERCQKGKPLPETDEGIHSALVGPRNA